MWWRPSGAMPHPQVVSTSSDSHMVPMIAPESCVMEKAVENRAGGSQWLGAVCLSVSLLGHIAVACFSPKLCLPLPWENDLNIGNIGWAMKLGVCANNYILYNYICLIYLHSIYVYILFIWINVYKYIYIYISSTADSLYAGHLL